MRIFIVPRHQLGEFFPKSIPLIDSVLERMPPETSIYLLKHELYQGTSQLIVAVENDEVIGLSILRKIRFPTGYTVMTIPFTAGTRMKEWLGKGLIIVAKYARENDCSELRGYSIRKAWLRALSSFDWYSVHEVIATRL